MTGPYVNRPAVAGWSVAVVLAVAAAVLLLTRPDAAAAPVPGPSVSATPTAEPNRFPHVGIYNMPPPFPPVAVFCDQSGRLVYESAGGNRVTLGAACKPGVRP